MNEKDMGVSREARAERRSAKSRWGFEVSDWQENHALRPLTFKPGATVFDDVVARSAQDLINNRVEVNPDFIRREWGLREARTYENGRKSSDVRNKK